MSNGVSPVQQRTRQMITSNDTHYEKEQNIKELIKVELKDQLLCH